MTATRLTQAEYLKRHECQVQALKLEADTLIAEGADVFSVVGALLWTAAAVGGQHGICPNRFVRLVDAMVDSAVEHARQAELGRGEGDDDDEIGGAWGEA